MGVAETKQQLFYWLADDGYPEYVKRKLEEALKISTKEVYDTIQEILHEEDMYGNPIYGEKDYMELDKETVDYIGNYKKFESRTNIRGGYIYIVENSKVYVFDVGIGEYINV